MSSTLHLGVRKSLNGDSVDAQSGVLAEIVPLGRLGKTIQLLVPIGPRDATRSIDVPPGELSVQVRLPSGEILTDNIRVDDGQEATLVLKSRRSPHEWMSWPRFLSSGSSQALPEMSVQHLAISSQVALWARAPGGAVSVLADRPWHEDKDDQQGLLSYTLANEPHGVIANRTSHGERILAAIDAPGVQKILATIPLPWNMRSPMARVQLLLTQPHIESSHPGIDVDVLVHDAWLAPMLGYLESGDLAAARHFEQLVVDHAEELLAAKSSNPIAAAAGGYLLLRTRALARLHNWPANLAAWFEWLPDGPIILATQLLRSRPGREARAAIVEHFMAAAARGAPLFTEGVQLLGDGLRLLGSWESTDSGRARKKQSSTRFDALVEWVESLESATRPNTLFTVLEGEDATLRRLVVGFRG